MLTWNSFTAIVELNTEECPCNDEREWKIEDKETRGCKSFYFARSYSSMILYKSDVKFQNMVY